MKNLILGFMAGIMLASCATSADCVDVYYRAVRQDNGLYRIEKIDNGEIYVVDYNLTYDDAEGILAVVNQ